MSATVSIVTDLPTVHGKGEHGPIDRMVPEIPVSEREVMRYPGAGTPNVRRIPWFRSKDAAEFVPPAPVVVSDANALVLYSEKANAIHYSVQRFCLFIDGEFRGAPLSVEIALSQVDFLRRRGFIAARARVEIIPVTVSEALR